MARYQYPNDPILHSGSGLLQTIQTTDRSGLGDCQKWMSCILLCTQISPVSPNMHHQVSGRAGDDFRLAFGEVLRAECPGYCREHTSTGKHSKFSSTSHVDWKDGNSSRTYVSELRWGQRARHQRASVCMLFEETLGRAARPRQVLALLSFKFFSPAAEWSVKVHCAVPDHGRAVHCLLGSSSVR